MTRRSVRTLVAAGMLLGVAGLLGVWAVGDTGEAASSPRHAADASPPAVRFAGPRTAYAAITDRPLFSPARRPPAVPVSAAAPTGDGVPFSGLIAVAIGPGRRAAILQLKSGGTAVLMQGEPVQGWTLSEISPNRVVVKSGPDQASLGFPGPPRGGAEGSASPSPAP